MENLTLTDSQQEELYDNLDKEKLSRLLTVDGEITIGYYATCVALRSLDKQHQA